MIPKPVFIALTFLNGAIALGNSLYGSPFVAGLNFAVAVACGYIWFNKP